jgi:hypothetical protein
MPSRPLPVSAVQPQPTRSTLAEARLQELWFATLRKPWKTLVVVPADAHTPALEIARALGDFGGRHRGTPVLVRATQGLDLREIGDLVASLGAVGRDPRGGTSIVAIDPIASNPMGIAAAIAADAALLCIRLGKTMLPAARHAIEQVGVERFIGCVVVC